MSTSFRLTHSEAGELGRRSAEGTGEAEGRWRGLTAGGGLRAGQTAWQKTVAGAEPTSPLNLPPGSSRRLRRSRRGLGGATLPGPGRPGSSSPAHLSRARRAVGGARGPHSAPSSSLSPEAPPRVSGPRPGSQAPPLYPSSASQADPQAPLPSRALAPAPAPAPRPRGPSISPPARVRSGYAPHSL